MDFPWTPAKKEMLHPLSFWTLAASLALSVEMALSLPVLVHFDSGYTTLFFKVPFGGVSFFLSISLVHSSYLPLPHPSSQ